MSSAEHARTKFWDCTKGPKYDFSILPATQGPDTPVLLQVLPKPFRATKAFSEVILMTRLLLHANMETEGQSTSRYSTGNFSKYESNVPCYHISSMICTFPPSNAQCWESFCRSPDINTLDDQIFYDLLMPSVIDICHFGGSQKSWSVHAMGFLPERDTMIQYDTPGKLIKESKNHTESQHHSSENGKKLRNLHF